MCSRSSPLWSPATLPTSVCARHAALSLLHATVPPGSLNATRLSRFDAHACPGAVIGPQGATIRRIQEETGARISVEKTGPNVSATITITGPDSAILSARQVVDGLVNPPRVVVLCESSRAGAVIGPKGATIRRLQEETRARINVNSDRVPCEITITGATDAIVAAAKRAVVR